MSTKQQNTHSCLQDIAKINTLISCKITPILIHCLQLWICDVIQTHKIIKDKRAYFAEYSR